MDREAKPEPADPDQKAKKRHLLGETRDGLKCPVCACSHFITLITRRRPGFVQRWKSCRYCGRRIITRERYADLKTVQPDPPPMPDMASPKPRRADGKHQG